MLVELSKRDYLMFCKSVYKNISKTALLNNKSRINLFRHLFGSTTKLKVMSNNEESARSSRRTGVPRGSNRSTSSGSAAARQIMSNTVEAMNTNLSSLLSRLSLVNTHQPPPPPPTPRATLISNLTFDGLLNHWKTHGFKRIITMVGAGISTSAGIPDFRSPETGLYNNLKKYNLPVPTDIFEFDYFLENPMPFLTLAKGLYPGSFAPTPVHYFVRLLHEKNLLVRHYTQNIDALERIAGIPEEMLVEAHGTLYTNHCHECRQPYSKEWMREKIFNDELPICDDCGSIVKPDVVFFGERLQERFYQLPGNDVKGCDLLIIMGTSLAVYPFASLIDSVSPNCIRLLINKNPVEKFNVRNPDNVRDVEFIGDCDDGIWQIAEALDWANELRALIDSENPDQNKKKVVAITTDNKPDEDSKRKTARSTTSSGRGSRRTA